MAKRLEQVFTTGLINLKELKTTEKNSNERKSLNHILRAINFLNGLSVFPNQRINSLLSLSISLVNSNRIIFIYNQPYESLAFGFSYDDKKPNEGSRPTIFVPRNYFEQCVYKPLDSLANIIAVASNIKDYYYGVYYPESDKSYIE